ncbi:hypothetical protein AYO49_04690 [Verrucomicrobiaceae bacterium SCGC AG-212-N21]|nr:hypothetical protein AYO49_04690 [Verrucomicrobiaceae bacterium SCGC AG-212-N21]
MKPHRANLILVLGILSIVGVCQPLGIWAWFMGNTDLREMNNGTMDASGRDTTNAGRILGIIGTVLFILTLLVLVVVLSMIGFAGAMGYLAAKKAEASHKAEIEYVEPAPAEPAPAR